MFEWLQGAWNSLTDWLSGLWQAFSDFMSDLGILFLDGLLGAIASLVESIPSPDFLTIGLDTYLSGIDPAVLYFLSRSGLTEAFAILGTAVVFRLTRKALTLGRW